MCHMVGGGWWGLKATRRAGAAVCPACLHHHSCVALRWLITTSRLLTCVCLY